MLDNKLDSAILPFDKGVMTVVILLDRADKMPRLAESPL
jgi:hypothetical protein